MPFRPRGQLQGAFAGDCRQLSNQQLVEKWVYRQIPYGFRTASAPYSDWRAGLAECLGIDSNSLLVVGSTAAGLSLSPNKSLRLHTPRSDVDLAVLSPELFQTSWEWFLAQHVERMTYPAAVRGWIDDHRTRLIFFRTIGSDQYLEYLPFGPAWVQCLAKASTHDLVGGRAVKVRIYQNREALTAYIIQGLADLRANLGL